MDTNGRFIRRFPRPDLHTFFESEKGNKEWTSNLPAYVQTRLAPALVPGTLAPLSFHQENPFPDFLFSLLEIQGAAKPMSIGAFGFCVFTITALSGRTSMSLYVRLPSAVARGNSWSLRTSNSFRPPQL